MKPITVLNGLTNLNARLVREKDGREFVELFIRLPAGLSAPDRPRKKRARRKPRPKRKRRPKR